MFFTHAPFAVLMVAIWTAIAGPPCSSSRPVALCAVSIRPWSDNIYEWKDVCGFTAAPNALIASNVDMYDEGYPCSSDEVATCCAEFTGCANGVDCDGPETASITTVAGNDALPEGWEVAIPCAVDDAQRVLANVIVSYQDTTTPATCVSECVSKGYEYAGVEYGDECYCGTGYAGGVIPTAANMSDCNVVCYGTPDYFCGGSWRMQIYKAPGAP